MQGLDRLLGGRKVTSCTERSLTKPGDNYGSRLLALDVTLDDSENLKLVAKLHPQHPMIAMLYSIPITFKNELNFYATVIGTLEGFRKKYGAEPLDLFPKFFGGRVSSKEGEREVDSDAAILLENLKEVGYELGDRTKGFDFPTAELLVRKLAAFHATCVAVKLREPQVFEEKVKGQVKRGTLMVTPIIAMMLNLVVDSVASVDAELAEVVRKSLPFDYAQYADNEVREPFATICHNDLWLNNVMVSAKGELKVRLFDFQVVDYGSPARDFLHFICGSVRTDVLAERFQQFLDLYYDTFISNLELLGCDSKAFGRAAFDEELKWQAPYQMAHTFAMVGAMYVKEDSVIGGDDLKDGKMPEFDLSKFHDGYVDRASQIAREFHARGWI